ncbi:hypothetical protein VTN00DRAFT_4059 [Thermoascus crustaceus]|uniref:uncharacterized protein n=1 Tax=Thermoascus crustaceus TaxID=5088 RepID=UPI0037426E07
MNCWCPADPQIITSKGIEGGCVVKTPTENESENRLTKADSRCRSGTAGRAPRRDRTWTGAVRSQKNRGDVETGVERLGQI